MHIPDHEQQRINDLIENPSTAMLLLVLGLVLPLVSPASMVIGLRRGLWIRSIRHQYGSLLEASRAEQLEKQQNRYLAMATILTLVWLAVGLTILALWLMLPGATGH